MEGFPKDFNLTNMRALVVQKELEAKQDEERESERLLKHYRASIYEDVMRDIGTRSHFDFVLSDQLSKEDVDTLCSEISNLFPGCLYIMRNNRFVEFTCTTFGWRNVRIQI